METRPTIYIASKTWHAPRWRELRESGVNIISSWIDFPTHCPVEEFERLWLACVGEASRADFTIIYAEPTDVMKGVLVEAGAALGAGRTVMQVGSCKSLSAGDGSDASFTHHPNWVRCLNLESALKTADTPEVLL